MNKRTLIIVVALALPLVVLALYAQKSNQAPPAPVPAADTNVQAGEKKARPMRRDSRPLTLEEARDRVRKRLAELEKMTPADWDAETRKRRNQRNRPPTLEAAIKRNQQILKNLEATTPEQWEEEQRKRRERREAAQKKAGAQTTP